MKLSAVVLTKNEEKNIGPCLRSIGWCDEVIVVDDYSQDKTIDECQKVKNLKELRVFQRKLNGNFAAQRNFGLKKARGEWVLFVDADERISAALAAEIKYQISTRPRLRLDEVGNLKSQIFGFYLKRQDFWGGRWIKHGDRPRQERGRGLIRLLRLAKKGAGRWERAVHEVWRVKGPVGELENPLWHYPHPTISEFLRDINFFSSLHAKVLFKERVKANSFQIVAYPLGKFCQNYFWRLGFLDGIQGLIVALMMSLHSFLARAKLYQLWKK